MTEAPQHGVSIYVCAINPLCSAYSTWILLPHIVKNSLVPFIKIDVPNVLVHMLLLRYAHLLTHTLAANTLSHLDSTLQRSTHVVMYI